MALSSSETRRPFSPLPFIQRARFPADLFTCWVTRIWAPVMANFIAITKGGVLVDLFISSAARHTIGNLTQIFGSEGTILLHNNDEKLRVARAGEDYVDMTETDPNASLPGVGKGIWNVSFVALIKEFTDAIREGRQPTWGATFVDGWRNQVAMDAVRQSWAERRWVKL